MIRFSTAGESHGEALIALVSGIPAGVPVDLDFVNHELWRRQQGYGRGGRMKIETDQAHILSGVRHGKTIGSPIAIQLINRDWKNWQEKLPVETGDPAKHRAVTSPRPGHADLAGALKFNFPDARYVLERASARESAARVAAGAFAKLLLRRLGNRSRQPCAFAWARSRLTPILRGTKSLPLPQKKRSCSPAPIPPPKRG